MSITDLFFDSFSTFSTVSYWTPLCTSVEKENCEIFRDVPSTPWDQREYFSLTLIISVCLICAPIPYDLKCLDTLSRTARRPSKSGFLLSKKFMKRLITCSSSVILLNGNSFPFFFYEFQLQIRKPLI